MPQILEFSELLITKLLHDLANTIGAINNGVEFLEEEDNTEEIKQKALQIIASNAKEASARIKFFRYIYGVTKNQGESDLQEMQSLVTEFFNESKYVVKWVNEQQEYGFIRMTNRESQLIACLVYIISSTLLHGGEILIKLYMLNGGRKVIVNASSDKIKVDDNIIKILETYQMDEVKLNNIQVCFVHELAKSTNAVIKCVQSDNQFKIEVSLV